MVSYLVGLVGVDFWWGFLVGLIVRPALWCGFLVGLFGGFFLWGFLVLLFSGAFWWGLLVMFFLVGLFGLAFWQNFFGGAFFLVGLFFVGFFFWWGFLVGLFG